MPPSKEKDKEKNDAATATRSSTRRRNGSLSTPDELQDIKNAQEGKKFLERLSLLCPPGEPVTHGALSVCLHQIAAIQGVPKQAVNAIRSAALLLEEMEDDAVNETVRAAFASQITEFTSDMKLLVDDVNTKIGEQLKDALKQITQAKGNAPAQTTTGGNGPQPPMNTSYAAALVNPPPNVNPKLAAKEGIRARQFLFTGIKDSAYGHHDTQQLKADLNKNAKQLGMTGGKIRSVLSQRDGSVLIEVDSDAAAHWFADITNRVEFCFLLGEEVSFKNRAYNVLAYNAPLTIDPTNANHKAEINEANGLEDSKVITALRWAKPINRRSEQQVSAHLVVSFANPEAANRAITKGLIICNKKCHTERIKREPLRCLKCQGWNHMAKDCEEALSKCSNCAENHRTANCLNPRKTRCVSCKSDGHASWSRECPVFLKKVDELNARNPDNLLPYFPTADPWTKSTGTTNSPSPPENRVGASNGVNSRIQQKQASTRTRAPREHDVYIPNPNGRQGPPHRTPSPFRDWWGDEPIRPPGSTPQATQSGSGNTVTFVNNSGPAGPSNPNPNSILTSTQPNPTTSATQPNA